MCEVNVNNFKKLLPDIRKHLESAKFIGLDLEFSALNPLKNSTPSLFDNPKQRYAKLRKNVEHTIPIQIGLTAFHFNPDKNHYFGNSYTFYVKPGLFSHINRYFHFEGSSLEFLALHDFDFNKFIYTGIPYLSKQQEKELRSLLDKNENVDMNFAFELRFVIESKQEAVSAWYKKAKDGDHLTFPEISKKFKNNFEFKYNFLKHFREMFPNLWTFENDDMITFKKVSETDFLKLEKTQNLDKELLENLIGFGEIYNILVSLKKPIVAHNALLDILILINNFEGSLPNSYNDFKKLSSKLFPIIYDTKHISYNVRKIIPREKQWDYTDLKFLFEYFKDGSGRHLAIHSPAIDIITDRDDYYGKYHEAGWDSFCAGYILIRMAFLKIHSNHPKSKIFMPVELLKGLKEFENCINVIRGSTNHIKLDGDDPETNRPPWLVVETLKNRKLNLKELSSTLSAYGNVEVRPIPWGNRAIVVVENYGSAKSMIRGVNEKEHPKFRIKQYSYIKHSPLIQAFVWGSVTLSSIGLIWLLHGSLKK